jgi:hypothetical protein
MFSVSRISGILFVAKGSTATSSAAQLAGINSVDNALLRF